MIKNPGRRKDEKIKKEGVIMKTSKRERERGREREREREREIERE